MGCKLSKKNKKTSLAHAESIPFCGGRKIIIFFPIQLNSFTICIAQSWSNCPEQQGHWFETSPSPQQAPTVSLPSHKQLQEQCLPRKGAPRARLGLWLWLCRQYVRHRVCPGLGGNMRLRSEHPLGLPQRASWGGRGWPHGHALG